MYHYLLYTEKVDNNNTIKVKFDFVEFMFNISSRDDQKLQVIWIKS